MARAREENGNNNNEAGDGHAEEDEALSECRPPSDGAPSETHSEAITRVEVNAKEAALYAPSQYMLRLLVSMFLRVSRALPHYLLLRSLVVAVRMEWRYQASV